MQKTLSVKVPENELARLKRIARLRKTTPSKLLRQSLERIIEDAQDLPAANTCFSLSEDLFRDLPSGPADLSSSKRHLDDFGK